MTDLQPYLDYFKVMLKYAKGGLLEVLPAAHEAYIVDNALYTLSYADDLDKKVQHAEQTDNKFERQWINAELFKSLTVTARFIRIFADFLNANAEGFKEYMEASEAAMDTPATSTAVAQAAENMRKPQIVNRPSATTIAPWCKSIQESSNRKLSETFALHVVSDNERHPLLYTILTTTRRRWYTPWKKTDHYEVITY